MKYKLASRSAATVLALGVAVWGGSSVDSSDKAALLPEPPLGLEPVPVPSDNPMTPEKIELGKQLFFDKRLSVDNTVSCSSCHHPKHGWSNGEAVATGVDGQKGGRSAPTILNAAYHYFNFWDGRAGGLEDQALGPVQNPIEMAMPGSDELEKKLNKIEGYRKQFQKVFGTDVTAENVAKAIAAFERTILSGNAPYDRYKAGDESALSEAAKRGMKVFFNDAHCSACHVGHSFTDFGFHNVGVSVKGSEADKGRAAISNLEGDTHSFKTPTLRDIAKTAPYMHDGSLETLEDVVEHYKKGGDDNPYLDEEIYPLKLTDQQKKDLVTFLKEGLTSDSYPDVKAPQLPQ